MFVAPRASLRPDEDLDLPSDLSTSINESDTRTHTPGLRRKPVLQRASSPRKQFQAQRPIFMPPTGPQHAHPVSTPAMLSSARPETPSPMTAEQRRSRYMPLSSTPTLSDAEAQKAELMRKYGHLSVQELTRVLSEQNRAVLDEHNQTHDPNDPNWGSQKEPKTRSRHIRQTPQHERKATRASIPCPDFVFPFRSGEAPESPEKIASDSARNSISTLSAPSPVRGEDHDPDSNPSTFPVPNLGSTRNRNSLRITIPPPTHPAYATRSDTPKIAVHEPLFETLECETPGWNRVGRLGVAGEKAKGEKKKVHGIKKGKRTEEKENDEGGCGCGCIIM